MLYADRLDPFAQFTRDDLELLSAIAAQTSVAVETVRDWAGTTLEEVRSWPDDPAGWPQDPLACARIAGQVPAG